MLACQGPPSIHREQFRIIVFDPQPLGAFDTLMYPAYHLRLTMPEKCASLQSHSSSANWCMFVGQTQNLFIACSDPSKCPTLKVYTSNILLF